MSRDQSVAHRGRVRDRLTEPSSAAGLAALLALLVPQFADQAPAIIDHALTVPASGTALWAIVCREGGR
jgi:hypothetical protein